jgi:thymidylate synthase (FAD)
VVRQPRDREAQCRFLTTATSSTSRRGAATNGSSKPRACPPRRVFKAGARRNNPGDEKLLRFLWEHKHATPFEMAGLVIEVQAPIFVFREWHRHRTQSYNELSARYTALPDLFYIPSHERLKAAKQSASNKQGSADGFSDEDAEKIAACLTTCYQNARYNYETLLQVGVAREIARLVIPVAQYSRMRASANLRNWLAFLTLRMAPNAQWEIRQYANAVGTGDRGAVPSNMATLR